MQNSGRLFLTGWIRSWQRISRNKKYIVANEKLFNLPLYKNNK